MDWKWPPVIGATSVTKQSGRPFIVVCKTSYPRESISSGGPLVGAVPNSAASRKNGASLNNFCNSAPFVKLTYLLQSLLFEMS